MCVISCLSFLKHYKSPVKEGYGDRFIPLRSKAVWHINFDVKSVSVSLHLL
jgi:hypothetical protein